MVHCTVRAGDLQAGTLPVSLIETLKARFDLVRIKGGAPAPLTPLNLIWHERTHADPASRAFRLVVERAFGRK